MDLREALATVVTAEDETPLRGALDALWASDLPPTTMLHVRRIQTGNVAGLGEGRRVSCEERRGAFHSLPLCIVRIWYPHLVPAATPLQ